MGSKKARRPRKRSEGSIKGKLVEKIVAGMHDAPGVTVTRNVKLPALGSSGRKREIDVLVETAVTGYPVKIAIECKNLSVKIDPERIDAFVGKLQAVGIPCQHGIYVAANGYTQGALDRARAAGIRPLVLTGLTSERIAAAVADAFQSLIYLLLSIDSLSVINDIEFGQGPDQLLVFYDESESICATVPDLVWAMWRDGTLQRDLGQHEVEIPINPDWYCLVNGDKNRPRSVNATVSVLGLVITLPGRATQHQLVNAIEEQVEKTHVSATFAQDTTEFPIVTVRTEAELDAALRHDGGVSVSVGRFPLPRILLFKMYWPPSEKTAETMERAVKRYLAGEGPDPRGLTLEDVEGTSLNSVWDPVWQGHRLHRD